MDRWVSNASPLLALSSVRQSDLLRSVLGDVIVPTEVVAEIGGVVRLPQGVQVVSDADTELVAALSLQMDIGEAAALALAARSHRGLVADDRRARRGAQRLGVPVIGTVGVVLAAWRRGLVADPLGLAKRLRQHGLWLSDELIDAVRQQCSK